MALSFGEMIRPINMNRIEQSDLNVLSALQLECFAKLLGIPHTGDKEKVSRRIFDSVQLRLRLAEIKQPQQLADGYKGVQLKDMARSVGVYIASNKYGQAVALLQWRNSCRRQGRQFLEQAQAEMRRYPMQKKLFSLYS